MSGVKHTPGPWRTSGVYIDSDFGMVGHVNYSSGLSRGCPEANARLIAAAPDLLEALELFSREYDGVEDGNGDPCPVLSKARDAIDRATGDRPEKGKQQ